MLKVYQNVVFNMSSKLTSELYPNISPDDGLNSMILFECLTHFDSSWVLK